MIEKNQYCCRKADKSTRNRDGSMSNCQIANFTAGVCVIAIKVDADIEDLVLSEKGQCYYYYKSMNEKNYV